MRITTPRIRGYKRQGILRRANFTERSADITAAHDKIFFTIIRKTLYVEYLFTSTPPDATHRKPRTPPAAGP